MFFRRIFFFILFYRRKSEAAMGRSGSALYFLGCRIAYKGGMDGAGFSLYISSEGSAKLRWVGREAYLGRGVAQ
jgi:hypothetical protein